MTAPQLTQQLLIMGLSRISKSAAGTSVAYTELIVEAHTHHCLTTNNTAI